MAEKRSARFATVAKWYAAGLWSRSRVERAVECGWVTEKEKDEILTKGSEDGS